MIGKLLSGVALAALIASATTASAATVNVTIKGFKFSPATITAHVGDTIQWTNEDPMNHSSTGTNHEWDVTIAPGKTGSVVVHAVGSVAYFCRFHPNMKGTVTVAK